MIALCGRLNVGKTGPKDAHWNAKITADLIHRTPGSSDSVAGVEATSFGVIAIPIRSTT